MSVNYRELSEYFSENHNMSCRIDALRVTDETDPDSGSMSVQHQPYLRCETSEPNFGNVSIHLYEPGDMVSDNYDIVCRPVDGLDVLPCYINGRQNDFFGEISFNLGRSTDSQTETRSLEARSGHYFEYWSRISPRVRSVFLYLGFNIPMIPASW